MGVRREGGRGTKSRMRSGEGKNEGDKPKNWYLGDLQSQARNGRCCAGTCHCSFPAGGGSLRRTVMTSRPQTSQGGRVDRQLHLPPLDTRKEQDGCRRVVSQSAEERRNES